MIRKILLSLASLFLIWQSYKLLSSLDQFIFESWWLNVLIGWLINLFITGIFAFFGFAFPTYKIFPESYYNVYNSNNLTKVYQTLNVDLFRKFLLATLWKSQKQRQKYFNGKKEGLPNLIKQSKKSEFGHLIQFIILCIVSFYMLAIHAYKLTVCTFLINVIGNFYPIIYRDIIE
ncbi:glycosyl-4,4'-diaponeurosporenoate acyltransferase CrtO family protein [Psychroflexus aestuariivivens]|uniref:glycosyl-4,4'-diaponeurosporenoate acyltransferase CrtO family protein n=1 Tax=Psychroflexus aestuariivivens TaxID=1795040 RepID=UPI000FDC320A|nr:hypothetical protein [Psychroflexus aestuariivivens]